MNFDELKESFQIGKISKSWEDFFFKIFSDDKLKEILEKVENDWKTNECYPKRDNVFRLFRELPLTKVKVVIIGQDPYYQPGVADGIAFSTEKKNYIPASLKNIFTELESDLKFNFERKCGSLVSWVKQGVFLINTALTVRSGEPLSHVSIWKNFTYQLLTYINNYNKNIVWVIWGKEAKVLRDKCQIDKSLCIESVHPSPFSANYGFFNSKPFSKVNNALINSKEKKIDWCSL